MSKKDFTRQDTQKSPDLSKSWRRPSGTHSKQRLNKKGYPSMPGVGRRTPKNTRGLHPSGREEIHVTNKTELETAIQQHEQRQEQEDMPGVTVRLSTRLSQRKKTRFTQTAAEHNLPVLNPSKHQNNTGED